jgi:hypothetical protein
MVVSLIFHLRVGTIWRAVVSFTPRPLYLRGKGSRGWEDPRVGLATVTSSCWKSNHADGLGTILYQS